MAISSIFHLKDYTTFSSYVDSDSHCQGMFNFLYLMPKVELHAHLNGSLSTSSLRDLGEKVYGNNTPEFHDLCKRASTFDKDQTLSDCFLKFNFIHELTATPKGLQYATEMVIRDFSKDNVIYLELRTTPKSNDNMSRRQYVEYVLASIAKARDKYPKILVKLLLSIDRADSVNVANDTVELALELSASNPVIVGIDLSGDPNKGTFKGFVPALKKAREGGLKLALHCAEVENPDETKEMLSFGMSRCGHGTFLTDEDIEQLKEQNVPVECCLTSNVKTKTVSSFGDHHFMKLLEADAPKVLCTDDSGIFDTTLTKEFFIATETYELTRSQCIDLTMDAIKHSFATNEERYQLGLQIEKYIEFLIEH